MNYLKIILQFGLQGSILPRLKECDVLLACHDVDRATRYDELNYSQLIDSISTFCSEQNISVQSIAKPYSDLYSAKCYGNPMPMNGDQVRSSLADKVLRLISRSYAPSQSPLVKLWEKIFLKTKCKLIIGIQPSWETCVAAKKTGVVSADLQHGIFSEDAGYYGTQYRDFVNQIGWPDWILCWNKESADWISNKAHIASKPWIVGHPWLSRFVHKVSSDVLINQIDRQCRLDRASEKTHILVTLTWNLEQYGYVTQLGIDDIVIDVINSSSNIRWLIRAHPMQMLPSTKRDLEQRMATAFSKSADIEWVLSSSCPLSSVLEIADLHITNHSSVTVEASWFGVPSALLFKDHLRLNTWLKGPIEAGMAQIIPPTSDALLEWISVTSDVTNCHQRRKSLLSSRECFLEFLDHIQLKKRERS